MKYYLLLITLFFLNTTFSQQIYEIFGGGGNSGAPWKNDYVVISGTAGTDLTGWSVQYTSANGSSWSKFNIPNGSVLNSNGYLIVLVSAPGTNGSSSYPSWCTPSAGTGTMAASATTGKFLLVNNQTLATTNCPSGNDLVAYGSGTDCAPRAPAPSNTTSIRRISSTGDNSVDFVVLNSPLPVIIDRFNVYFKNEKVNLNWATASEQNNDRFEIERSADADRFDQIGSVKGAGTSFLTNTYNFIDEAPLAGRSYYRLKQIDNDGQYDYSPVRTVVMGTAQDISLIPTVTSSSFRIEFGGSLKTDAVINLIAIGTGQSVYQMNVPAETDSQVIPVDNLPSGTYFVRIQNGQEVISKMFVKVD